jgi:adenylyl-sulfate kinase
MQARSSTLEQATDLDLVPQKGFTIWLTGLSGTGKTTTAVLLEKKLRAQRVCVEVLDGDAIRDVISRNLGFSKAGRDENVYRLAFIANLLSRNGVAVIVAAISPYRAARETARTIIGDFIEVHLRCSLNVLVQRDPKGLYRRALTGELSHFTGVSDPYEQPLHPEIELNSDMESPEEGVERIWSALVSCGWVPRD